MFLRNPRGGKRACTLLCCFSEALSLRGSPANTAIGFDFYVSVAQIQGKRVTTFNKNNIRRGNIFIS